MDCGTVLKIEQNYHKQFRNKVTEIVIKCSNKDIALRSYSDDCCDKCSWFTNFTNKDIIGTTITKIEKGMVIDEDTREIIIKTDCGRKFIIELNRCQHKEYHSFHWDINIK